MSTFSGKDQTVVPTSKLANPPAADPQHDPSILIDEDSKSHPFAGFSDNRLDSFLGWRAARLLSTIFDNFYDNI